MNEREIEAVRRPGPARRLFAALAALLLFAAIVLALLWSMRVRIASEYLERELAKRDIDATYDVKRIGLGSQVFENLVIGDPAAPDLTARRVEVEIGWGPGGPRVGLITARGVRVRGRIEEGRLDLGQLDRLAPPRPDDAPFRLPDQRVDIADSAIVIDSPAGRFAVALDGRGNLADGFEGKAALRSRGLQLGGCRLDDPRGRLAVSVEDRRPRLRGPLGLDALRCGEDLSVAAPRIEVAATLGPAFESWEGRGDVTAGRLRSESVVLRDLVGDVSFAGDAERTTGAVRAAAAASRAADFRAGRTAIEAGYVLSPLAGALDLAGDVALRSLTVDRAALAPLAASLRGIGDFPVAPIADRLAEALVAAGTSGADARADFRLVSRDQGGLVRFRSLRAEAASGARVRLAGGDGLTWSWPDGALQIDGELVAGGGGLPDARFALDQGRPGGPVEGRGRIAPMAAGGARLDLGEIRVTAAPDGTTRVATTARMTGPFQGGRVEALTIPVAGRFGGGAFAFGEECVTAAFRSFRYADLEVGPTRLPLCPTGPAIVRSGPGGTVRGGFAVPDPRIAGTIGGTPLRLAAERLRFGLPEADFTVTGLNAAIGAAPSVQRIEIASLTGAFGEDGAGGGFEGLTGRIANVPLLVDQGAGDWRLAGGTLTADGRVRVSDTADPPRFYPLVSDDFRLTLANGTIRAGGWLADPETGTPVTEAAIVHDLSTGAGSAVLDVPGIAFAEGGLQPDDLTPMTVGVVALVDGTVTGRGRIEWDGAGVTSTGSFATEDMDLAAPFGPVEGLTTRVEFTDLLGMVSAPGQVAEIGLVRTGIDVFDGLVTYSLLPGNRVRVAAGRWPYAGGTLLLEPTILDFSQPSTKYLTFRVIGLEAARFVQMMEFTNIMATGTFDGIIPIVVDQDGARIVDGRLAAREPGGTLSYIGELTDRDLGVYGKLAFDALKALRYSRFEMLLNGSLGGEFVTLVELDGIARDPALTAIEGGGLREALARRVLGQLARIPFEFNIKIEGPFQALMATARSFEDPLPLIRGALPPGLRGLPTDTPDVQDEESEDMR